MPTCRVAGAAIAVSNPPVTTASATTAASRRERKLRCNIETPLEFPLSRGLGENTKPKAAERKGTEPRGVYLVRWRSRWTRTRWEPRNHEWNTDNHAPALRVPRRSAGHRRDPSTPELDHGVQPTRCASGRVAGPGGEHPREAGARACRSVGLGTRGGPSRHPHRLRRRAARVADDLSLARHRLGRDGVSHEE